MRDEADHRGVTFAVLDDPEGGSYVEAPESHSEMTELALAARGAGRAFYCATRVGGCGEPLTVVNGLQRRPHFRHRPGSACALRRDQEARDRYTHRAIQDALVAWLTSLGHSARAEHYVSRQSRVDVHCQPHSVIEVQLSGETTVSMIERTGRYGPRVTWLFGTVAGITSRDSIRHDQGAVLVVRLAPRPEIRSVADLARFRSREVEVGVSHEPYGEVKEGVQWSPLSGCSFDPQRGVLVPGHREILDKVAAHRAALADIARRAVQAQEEQRDREREAAKQRAAASIAKGAPTGPKWAPERSSASDPRAAERAARDQAVLEARSRAAHLRGSSTKDASSDAGPRPTVLDAAGLRQWEGTFARVAPTSGPWSRVLAGDLVGYASRVDQIDARWATGFPAHLVDVAWATLHYTMLIQSAPLTTLAEPELDPDSLVVRRLQDLGMIAVVRCGDQDYFETAHDLRYVGTPVPWQQPPAWSPPPTDDPLVPAHGSEGEPDCRAAPEGGVRTGWVRPPDCQPGGGGCRR